jgi:hypothetical protein
MRHMVPGTSAIHLRSEKQTSGHVSLKYCNGIVSIGEISQARTMSRFEEVPGSLGYR